MYVNEVNIRIKDFVWFKSVAVIIDRDDFLINLKNARAALGLERPIPYIKLEEWKKEELEQELKKTPIKEVEPPKRAVKAFEVPRTLSEKIISKFLEVYKLPDYFWGVIESVLITHTVTDEECWGTTYTKIVYSEDYIGDYKISANDFPQRSRLQF